MVSSRSSRPSRMSADTCRVSRSVCVTARNVVDAVVRGVNTFARSGCHEPREVDGGVSDAATA